jgi:hypothetical protein
MLVKLSIVEDQASLYDDNYVDLYSLENVISSNFTFGLCLLIKYQRKKWWNIFGVIIL